MNAIAPIDTSSLQSIGLDIVRSADGTRAPQFASLIGQGVTNLDAQVAGAERALAALSLGHEIPVHQVMIAMEQARFSLQVAVEFRNRLVAAHEELFRIPM